MKSKRFKRVLIVGGPASLAVLAVAVAAAVAGSSSSRSDQGPQISPGVISTGGAGGVLTTRISTQTDPFTTSSATYVALPGGIVTVPIPADTAVLIVAEFTAETACSGGGGEPDFCQARIQIANVEGNPKADGSGSGPFALDSTNNGREGPNSWAGHAFTRSRVVRSGSSPINVAVQVFVKVTNFGGTAPDFWLDDYHLQATAYTGGFGLS